MEKEFVPYEPSLALKELGFDEPCFGYRDGGGYLMIKEIPHCVISAPTFSQAFRWFREKYDLYGTIRYGYNEFDKSVFLFPCINGISGNDSFGKQEEAELECLKKLIEIVKRKVV